MASSVNDRVPRPVVLIAFRVLLLVATAALPSVAENQSEPLVIVENGRYGYIDHTGKIIIRPQFIWAEDFWRGLGSVYVCGRWVSIDSSGALSPYRIAIEGRLEPEKKGQKFGFVDASRQFKIPPTFDDVLPFSDGLAAVRIGEKWGFIDAAGQEVIPPQFSAAYYFREGVATASSDAGDVLIDRSGKVVATGFQSVDLIVDGRVPASRKEKEGYLNLQGKIVIPFVYDEVRRFSGGLAAVEKDGKWGYVDYDGQVVIPLKFEEAGEFASGLAPARIGTTSGFIDKKGAFSFYLAFRHAAGFFTGEAETGLFLADSDVSRFWTDDDRFGYVNTSGHVIWGPFADGPGPHPPLFGWSEAEKARSCEGIPESTRNLISGFPRQ